MAFVGSSPTDFPDVYVAPIATMAAKKVSDTGAQIASWPKHLREVIRWKSQDGAEIEGVLHKPADFQAGRRYPLLVVIHGGPTGVSRPVPYGSVGYYPLDAFLAKGALVLEPNYRGSAGYGERFRSLNVRNLGIGDAWDVLSDRRARATGARRSRSRRQHGLEPGRLHLRVPHHAPLDRFKAISVGAGISDWMTYYVNTDIHPFTRQYLKSTPGRSEDLRRHLTDDLYQAGAHADADPARQGRCARADSECVPAVSGLRDQNVRCSCRSSTASATA